ncbi:MAG: TolC family protein [Pirellulales bacterium]|nr:TolC family protein [Pirellulales bacterium]
MREPELPWRFMRIALVCACCLLAGCAGLPGTRRASVSEQLSCRTGHGLGADKPPCQALIPAGIVLDDGLTEDEAVTLGLWNNPAYQELLADLLLTRADIIAAGQLANPQITSLFPVGVKQWEFFLILPIDAIYLRPRRVLVAQLEDQRVAERLVQDGLNVIRDVRVAYIDLLLAEQRYQLALYGENLRQEFKRVAEARLRAGAVAELEVSPIRLDTLANVEEVARTARDIDLARERLRFRLGLATFDVPLRTAPPAAIQLPPLDREGLVGLATSSRPDLRAAQLAFSAAAERHTLSLYDYFNTGAFLPDINSRGEKGFEAGPGLRFDLPILNQNQGNRARAMAQAERLRRTYVLLRDTAANEVRLAYYQLEQAEQTLAIWKEQVVPQAQAAVEHARAAMLEDNVAMLAVFDTTRQLLNSRARELDAEAALRRAVAELERSVGRRLLFDGPSAATIESIPPPPAAPDLPAKPAEGPPQDAQQAPAINLFSPPRGHRMQPGNQERA